MPRETKLIMSHGSHYQPNLQLRQPPPKIEAFEFFLELIPYPTILLDANKGCILLANSRVAELTYYTRAELTGLDPKSLFSDWQESVEKNHDANRTQKEAPGTLRRLSAKTLMRRNQTSISVQLTCMPVSQDEKLSIIILEPADFKGSLTQLGSSDQLWETLNLLAIALQESELESGIDQTLKAGRALVGAETWAVYLAQDHHPGLQCNTSFGPTIALPDQLSAQDLFQLNKPSLWLSGKRPTHVLHRAARAAQLSYLASAPIGQPNAIIGLLVAADRHLSPPAFILQVAELLGSTLATLFQGHARAQELQSQLTEGISQLRAHATLEEHLREGVIMLAPDLRILQMNLFAEMILGYANQEVVGQLVEKVLIGAESLLPALTAAKEGSATYNLGNVQVYRRDGDDFPALIRVFPVMHESQVERIIILVQDLSEQEQTRLQTQQLEHRAILGEFTAVFAHEVRNPINNISTGLQLMAYNIPEDDPNQEAIAGMLQDCDRLDSLIKSVLALSRPTDHTMVAVDLPLLLQRLLERLRPRIIRINAQYSFEVEPDCPPIWGNVRSLEQVFSNLITNALQAMSESGGTLALKVQPIHSPEGSNFLEVSVADTGPGIPEELQERIFQPFFTTKQEGTGLGLAIAKRIITAHKGSIRLTSFPGGTIFHVQLPTIATE